MVLLGRFFLALAIIYNERGERPGICTTSVKSGRRQAFGAKSTGLVARQSIGSKVTPRLPRLRWCVGDHDAALFANRAAKRPVLSRDLAGLEADQVHLMTGETSHRQTGVGIVDWSYLNDKTAHGKSGVGAAKEKWRHDDPGHQGGRSYSSPSRAAASDRKRGYGALVGGARLRYADGGQSQRGLAA
jgi:hypothetical protein